MRLLFLLFTLQSDPTGARASATDSAVARTVLLTGLAAFDSVMGNVIPQFVAIRYLEQLHVWRLKEEGSEAAIRFDEAARQLHGYRSTIYVSAWISTLLKAGDTATVDNLLPRLPPFDREEAMSMAASSFDQPQRISALLEARMTRPWPRAQVMRDRAWRARNRDSAEARTILVEAIDLSRNDSTGQYYAWKFMVDLLQLGGQVAVDDIVQAAVKAEGDLWNGRRVVAGALNEYGVPPFARALARPLVDSLEAGIQLLDASKRLEARLEVLLLRGTASDSARAVLVRDSLDAVDDSLPEAIYMRRVGRERSALLTSGSSIDPRALQVALSRPLTDDALLAFLEYLRTITSFGSNDTLRQYAQIAVAQTGEHIRSRPGELRDSMQVYRVAAQSFLDARLGLELAKSIRIQRFRDRAISEAITRLAPIDADLAEREAATLQDSTARASAYGALSRNAVAGRRFPESASLATRATGDQRARSLFELAVKQKESGRLNDARRSAAGALDALNPELRCDGCHGRAPGFVPSDLTRGTDPDLTAEVAFLMVQLGMRDQLLTWSSTLQGSASRAHAYLVLVEAMSRHLLRWHPPLRIH